MAFFFLPESDVEGDRSSSMSTGDVDRAGDPVRPGLLLGEAADDVPGEAAPSSEPPAAGETLFDGVVLAGVVLAGVCLGRGCLGRGCSNSL